MGQDRSSLIRALARNHDVIQMALETQAALIEALAASLPDDAPPAAPAPDPEPVVEPAPEPAPPRRHRIADLCDHPEFAIALDTRVCADCGANF